MVALAKRRSIGESVGGELRLRVDYGGGERWGEVYREKALRREDEFRCKGGERKRLWPQEKLCNHNLTGK